MATILKNRNFFIGLISHIDKHVKMYISAKFYVCNTVNNSSAYPPNYGSNSSFESHQYSFHVLFKTFMPIVPEFVFLKTKTIRKLILFSLLWSSPNIDIILVISTLFLRIVF